MKNKEIQILKSAKWMKNKLMVLGIPKEDNQEVKINFYILNSREINFKEGIKKEEKCIQQCRSVITSWNVWIRRLK